MRPRSVTGAARITVTPGAPPRSGPGTSGGGAVGGQLGVKGQRQDAAGAHRHRAPVSSARVWAASRSSRSRGADEDAGEVALHPAMRTGLSKLSADVRRHCAAPPTAGRAATPGRAGRPGPRRQQDHAGAGRSAGVPARRRRASGACSPSGAQLVHGSCSRHRQDDRLGGLQLPLGAQGKRVRPQLAQRRDAHGKPLQRQDADPRAATSRSSPAAAGEELLPWDLADLQPPHRLAQAGAGFEQTSGLS